MPIKKSFIILSILIIFLLALSTQLMAGQFRVTRVYDGDTIMAEGHDIVIYVLLAGIDAPEIGSRKQQRQQPYGQEAKKYLENVILNKIADIKGYGIGLYPYNHLIGEIYVEDKNINIEMIKEGFAEVCTERPPEGLNITPYLEAEREAKAAGRGMWSLGDKYMSPAQWRKIHKGG
jgi:micrococcal nuclease